MGWQRKARGRFSETYPIERRSMRLKDWPELDRLAFEHARHQGDVFELPGPAAAWAPLTCLTRIEAYGRGLNFLSRHGLLLEAEGVAERWSPERLALYIAQDKPLLSPSTIAQRLVELYRMLRAMVPDRDWRWIIRHPGRPKRREIQAARKPKFTFNPLALCSHALDLLDHINNSPYAENLLVQYRDALIVATQCTFALRRRNLVEMALGRNLIVDEGVIHVIFTRNETKNGSAIRCTMPGFLEPYFGKYLDYYRISMLAGHSSDALWINCRHQPLGYGACPYLFSEIGMRLLGQPITCHMFRHSTATTILTKDPRKIRMAAGVLMHEGLGPSISTTTTVATSEVVGFGRRLGATLFGARRCRRQ